MVYPIHIPLNHYKVPFFLNPIESPIESQQKVPAKNRKMDVTQVLMARLGWSSSNEGCFFMKLHKAQAVPVSQAISFLISIIYVIFKTYSIDTWYSINDNNNDNNDHYENDKNDHNDKNDNISYRL